MAGFPDRAELDILINYFYQVNEFTQYNDEEADRVARLIAGYIQGTLSEKDHDELDAWIVSSDENLQLFERLTDEKTLEEVAKRIQKLKKDKASRKAN